MMRSSGSYAAFVVGFAIMTDSMIYTLVLPFLPDLLTSRLHVPEGEVSKWIVFAFEAFAITTLLTNGVVGSFVESSASKSKPFLISVLIMLFSTTLFFVATTPVMIVIARAIQGASTTFTWVTGLAFLVTQVGEGDLGTYVGWTTVGVAVGEMVGPMVGGPIYDYLGHWAAFGVVTALLFVDILLRVFARDKKPEWEEGTHTAQGTDALSEQSTAADSEDGSETERLLPHGLSSLPAYDTISGKTTEIETLTHGDIARSLALNWAGTVFTLIVIFMIRGALEVAVPLYLTRQYSWTPTKISLTLLTLTLPAAVNPLVGRFTSRQGPRWWSTGAFAVCGAVMVSFGSVAGDSSQSQRLFLLHSTAAGLALAILINSNQVAISVAAQRFGNTKTRAEFANEDLGRILSRISPGMMLSGVTTSWSAGVLLGPAYSSLIPYTEDDGWMVFCHGLGSLCFLAALGSAFLWRKW